MRAAAALAGAALLAGCGVRGADGAELSAAPPAAALPAGTAAVAAAGLADHPPGAGGRSRAAPPAPLPGASGGGAGILQELLASDGTAQWERHLAGPWYRLAPAEAGAAPDRGLQLILFEPDQRRVTLFEGDVQESYLWDDSHRPPAPRIGIRARNELVPSIERTIDVEVVTGAEIRMAMQGGDHHFDGNYRKLDADARARLARAGAVRRGPVELDLAGRYLDATGQAIDFEPPRFTWQTGDQQVSGVYALYSLERLIIVFKVTSPAGITRELRTYTVDYRQWHRGERLLRSLVLHPARLEISGVADAGAAALHFERLEFTDEATTEDQGVDDDALVLISSSADER